MATKSTKNANATRAQKAKAAHEEGTKSRANDQQFVKAGYLSGNGEVILEDLKKKIPLWMGLNSKIAQDGVAARATGYKLQDGTPEIENVFLKDSERVGYLNENRGMQKILDYIDRQLTQPQPDQKPSKKQKDVAKTEA